MRGLKRVFRGILTPSLLAPATCAGLSDAEKRDLIEYLKTH